MALTITSPGVQINEKDLSLRANLPAGTTVVVPGFAPQGPSSEPLQITSVSELEAVYGTPTTAAERYFYYSCREVLNSPANLTTIRLPYGDDTGAGFQQAYSGLFYPMVSSESGWIIGAPAHKDLTVEEYEKIQTGNFEWQLNNTVESHLTTTIVNSSVTFAEVSSANLFIADLSAVDPTPNTYGIYFNDNGSATVTFQTSATTTVIDSVGTTGYDTNLNVINAGFFVVNDLQTTINELGEGYYMGVASNIGLSALSVDYNAVQTIKTLSSTSLSADYSAISTSRLDFQLSASQIESDRGTVSVSELLQKAGFADYGLNSYSDHISLGIYKIRRSTVDANVLSFVPIEKFVGSLDVNRLKTSPTGGTLANAFIEDVVNANSSAMKVFVNPVVASSAWYDSNTNTRKQASVNDSAKALFALGSYVPNATDLENSKSIGEVPAKIDKAFRSIESTENTTIDVVCDAGLSTIYSTVQALGVKSFDDSAYIENVDDLRDNWVAVSDYLVNFSQNLRKDCVTILDPSRQIFVTGKDKKVITSPGKRFTQDIFNPLRNQIGTFGSNYAATYGNWVKVNDLFTNKNVWVPFSGYAAAVFARNDQVAQPWAAPGGLNRGTFNVVDIAFNPNQKQRDRLYEIAVNPVVFFSGDGYAIYGQKTLQTKPTAFDRLNVRRLFLALERSVQRSLKYFVFEPNTDFTRTRLKNVITPIFDYAKNTEGLYDYLIVADERNNTPDIIDQNQLIVDIYLKPVRTAEFILVNFIATRTGQNFQELI